MGTWKWIVNGKEVRGEGETEEEAWANYNFVNPGPEHGGEGRGYPTPKGFGGANEIFEGVFQGALDPFEGIAQLAEHMAGRKLVPESIRNKARDFRTKVQSTTGGQLGEIAGNIGTMAVPGGLAAKGLGAAGRAATAAGVGIPRYIPWAARGLEGGLAGAAQPVQGARTPEEFNRMKNEQIGWGTLAGSTLPALASQVGRLRPPAFSHWSWHHPLASIAARAAPAIGRGVQDVAPAAVGGPAGVITEESEREE